MTRFFGAGSVLKPNYVGKIFFKILVYDNLNLSELTKK